MFRVGSVFILFLSGFCVSGYAQSNDESLQPVVQVKTVQSANVGLNGSYFKGYLSDTGAIMTSPLHWKGSQWREATLVAGITAALYSVDGKVKREVQENRTSWGNETARAARRFGEGQYTLPAMGTLYLYGRFTEDEKAEETALLGLESFVVSGVFTGALKALGHRDRPNTGHPSDTWHGPGLSSSNLSFPSGHSTSAFSLATVFATEYADNRFVPPTAYGIATLTALSRVNDNAHWFSDVFFGSAVGYFTARAICTMHSGAGTAVLPVVDGKYAGFMINHPY